ncbi:MAG: helix-turn-helix transcriptional regulator [Clostridia bacterium]|nr:helix-turn-helix transcriptional regulator [Clostridia bacterium]
MVHSYDMRYLIKVRRKLSNLFCLATEREHMSLDEFMEKFISSGMAQKFETANPIYVLGKSENELLKIILRRDLDLGSPEIYVYASWTGYVLAYAQWYLRKTYKEITDLFPCSQMEEYAHRSEGEAIPKIMKVIKERISYKPPLQEYREKAGYTQAQLAEYSRVPVEKIISYETDEEDISCAEAGTLYNLAKALGCSMEDIIC